MHVINFKYIKTFPIFASEITKTYTQFSLHINFLPTYTSIKIGSIFRTV